MSDEKRSSLHVIYMYEIKGRNSEALINKVSLELRIQVFFPQQPIRVQRRFREGSAEVLALEIPVEGRFQERFRVGSEDSKEVCRRGTFKIKL